MPYENEDGYNLPAPLHPSDEQSVSNSNDKPQSRVWRACLECRLKKRKCDGKDVCQPCQSRKRVCEYPESNDNASSSRQLNVKLEERCQQMEALCEEMKTLMGKFANTVDNLDVFRQTATAHAVSTDVHQTPNTQLLPREFESTERLPNNSNTSFIEGSTGIDLNADEIQTQGRGDASSTNQAGLVEDDDDDDDDDDDEQLPGASEKGTLDHIMTLDSYGKLRFVGGTSTMLMVEALRSLNPSEAGSPMDSHTSPGDHNVSIIELPWFSRGKTWPRLPHLPHAGQLPRPPRYVSDLLVNIYFEQLHYTFPVLYKSHFLQRYQLLVNARRWDTVDVGFLSVFFAVCACASGLLPRESETTSTFPGIKFYESAVLLHYGSTGEGSIEQVQCLSLLSICSAGWNTLAQSWKWAGQAVRAAQDLGLHRSPARGAGNFLKEELCRRIWWSVYGLDRVLSTCLGRPMAIDDADCDSELPKDLDDSDLEAYSKGALNSQEIIARPGTSLLAGFIAFSRLCQISGNITRSINVLHIRRLKEKYGRKKGKAKLREIAQLLDEELAEWLRNVPDSVKFSVNNPNSESTHLAMCVISYILHAGCVINLHRPLIRVTPRGTKAPTDQSSYNRCLDAAKSCIQVAELIQDRVPPSHHLAYCSHHLALSGIILLRLSESETPDVTRDITACIQYLTTLEPVFTGAKRSRLIVEELLRNSRMLQSQKKRAYSEIGSDEVDFTSDFLNHEIFTDFSYPYIEGIGLGNSN